MHARNPLLQAVGAPRIMTMTQSPPPTSSSSLQSPPGLKLADGGKKIASAVLSEKVVHTSPRYDFYSSRIMQ